MCHYLESIKLLDGRFYRLDLHQQRMNLVKDMFYPNFEAIDLQEYLHKSNYPLKGLYKCRIIYAQEIFSIEFQEYTIKPIQTVKLVSAQIPSSNFKSEDRALLNQAYARRCACDDVLIVVDGMLKDSWYCNIALFDGVNWITPSNPLISGVNRAELIAKAVIIEREIPASTLSEYLKVRLFNAMIEFGEIELPCDRIY